MIKWKDFSFLSSFSGRGGILISSFHFNLTYMTQEVQNVNCKSPPSNKQTNKKRTKRDLLKEQVKIIYKLRKLQKRSIQSITLRAGHKGCTYII